MSHVRVVVSGGRASCVYRDHLPLEGLGRGTVRRAGDVEPHPDGGWEVTLREGGQKVGTYPTRGEGLLAEERAVQSLLESD